MAQIFSPLAGQNRFGGRLSQTGQLIHTPQACKKTFKEKTSDYGSYGMRQIAGRQMARP
jgi:hypothetical protein